MAWHGEKVRFWFPVTLLGGGLAVLVVRLVMLHLGYVEIAKEPTYTLVRNSIAMRGGIYSSTGVPYARTKTLSARAVRRTPPSGGRTSPTSPRR